MKLLTDLLDQYKELRPPNDTIRRECIVVLQNTCNVTIPFEHVRFDNGTIYITAHPSVKNHIYMNKHRILKEIGRTNVTDIR